MLLGLARTGSDLLGFRGHRFWQGVESGQILVEMLGFAAVDGFFLQSKEKLMIYGGFEVFANVLGVFVVFLAISRLLGQGRPGVYFVLLVGPGFYVK